MRSSGVTDTLHPVSDVITIPFGLKGALVLAHKVVGNESGHTD
jgi:hypothetical protein